ncbi:glycosyltransferase [Lacinutrix sp. Hel_I_90]|uniref:glycosyltransferase family 2 protein n=1 Tax=Lacinutrix sp. Hel_I_90 TaxID=1249999 RepID=UPI0005C9C9E0|nr:glycosyltransferase [Lacinutrix sp. Hel_I_90]
MLNLTFIVITVLYFVLILSFVYGFSKVKTFKRKGTKQKTTFSVVIPFRNEAENLEALLASILSLRYDKAQYEVILINDESEDDSVAIIENLLNASEVSQQNTVGITQTDITIIQNNRTSNAPKKDAITSAISIAKHDWIVTTDADCIIPNYWLSDFDAFIQEHEPKMIVAPVSYNTMTSFLKRFQLLDFLSLIGATIGGFGMQRPFLCNGANLAYHKSLFKALKGFDGNTNIASGDDIFLMEKALKADKNSVHYLKSESAIILTKPQPNWKSLVSQRKRWAAKTSNYQSAFGKLTGLIVLFMNASLIISLILAVITVGNWPTFLLIFLLKITADFLLLYKTSAFFSQTRYLASFPVSALIYPFFSVYIAMSSLFTSYKWKERRFKK